MEIQQRGPLSSSRHSAMPISVKIKECFGSTMNPFVHGLIVWISTGIQIFYNTARASSTFGKPQICSTQILSQ